MSSAVHSLHTQIGSIAPDPDAREKDGLENMQWLPFTLSLEVPVAHFTIANLLSLKPGSIVETACHHTSDIPLRVNKVLIGWSEFAVVGDRLAARITEQL